MRWRACGHKGGTGSLDNSLLTPDILERFPYTVHPKNLALAFELGRQLGLTDAFCVKEIADHLVPDLGVLKTYPEVFVAGGRALRFSNGCSANARAGTMNNWRRLSLDNPDHDCSGSLPPAR